MQNRGVQCFEKKVKKAPNNLKSAKKKYLWKILPADWTGSKMSNFFLQFIVKMSDGVVPRSVTIKLIKLLQSINETKIYTGEN